MPLPEIDKESTSLIVIDDLRRLYDHINNNWINLKNRVLAVAFGEVAIASFIFSEKFKLKEFSPAELIFFFTGAGLIISSFIILIWIISTSNWVIPLDVPESKKLYKNYGSKLEYIEYIEEDYENSIQFCLKKMDTRSKVFNKVLIGMTAGILIMLVIKFTK